MFVLFFFAYSLAATCCSLANANTGPRKEKVAFPEPRNINEVEVQMKKCLEEKYNDPTEHLIAEDLHAKWSFMAAQAQTALNSELENVLRETKTLKVKLSLRTEVSKLFEYLSPIWLRQLTLKERYKWRLLLQLETESTELLKRIITQQMNLTVDQFSEDMEELMQISARGTYSDYLPHLECEEELDEILRSLEFTKDSLRKSLIAVIYRFQNEKHTVAFGSGSKYCFVHFPSLKQETTAEDIVDFLNFYFPNTVHIDDVTIFEEETDEKGSSLNNVQAFIRLNKTIQNDRKEEINKLKNLEPMCDEIKEMTQSFTPQIPARTIEVPPKKTQLVYKFCNSKPLILA